jgi:hypothetical protein
MRTLPPRHAAPSSVRSRKSCEFEPLEPRALFSSAPDVVLDWNHVLIDVLRADRTLPGPGWSSRSGAMMFAAIFDAINSIEKKYEPYLVNANAPRGTSEVAAAAAAGWRVLSSLYPEQKSTADAALIKSLKRVKDGVGENRGVALGIWIANQVLKARANDGSAATVAYTPGSDPGDWQPTAPDFTPAWGPGWGKVTPFSDLKVSDFIPDPPPALDSPEYTAAFNEVKSLGEADSSTRTADQTEIGIFWGYDRAGMGTPPTMYNQMTEVIARDRRNSTIQNARLFALVNIAMADSGIVAWESKFLYNLWRPVTAIQKADTDGNPDTTADPAWEPLGAPGGTGANFTPPFPAYVSGHATFGAAAVKVLADFYGSDRMRFTLVSDELPGVKRTYTSFSKRRGRMASVASISASTGRSTTPKDKSSGAMWRTSSSRQSWNAGGRNSADGCRMTRNSSRCRRRA